MHKDKKGMDPVIIIIFKVLCIKVLNLKLSFFGRTEPYKFKWSNM